MFIRLLVLGCILLKNGLDAKWKNKKSRIVFLQFFIQIGVRISMLKNGNNLKNQTILVLVFVEYIQIYAYVCVENIVAV